MDYWFFPSVTRDFISGLLDRCAVELLLIEAAIFGLDSSGIHIHEAMAKTGTASREDLAALLLVNPLGAFVRQ